MKLIKKNKIGVILLGTSLVTIIGLLVGLYYQHANDYPDTFNLAQKMRTVNHGTKILVFHKTGCSDCQKIKKLVTKTIRQNPERHYIVMNSADPQTHNYFKQYHVTNVPTIMVSKKGKIVGSYSGLDRRIITKLLSVESR
ncbi:thioredoxin family protein [Leuconostoc pseudomesenteroides]|uniref:thioredoxin family protein n=1 Tax=Leuconostoc pseudomesenteroides TaxID=33968 RepID=UPI0039EAB889